MKKELFLHIGFPKTGTTSIQYFLGKNSDVLKSEYDLDYLYYSDPKATHISEFSYCYNKIFISDPIQINSEQPPLINGTNPDILKELFSKITESQCQRIVISSESFIKLSDFSFLNHSFFQDYNVKIIAYIRNSIEYLCSLWSYHYNNLESATLQYDTLESFIQEDRDYQLELEKLYNLQNSIKKDNIIIKTFEKSRYSSTSLIEDFLEIFNIKISNTMHTISHVNANNSTRRTNDIIRALSAVYDNIAFKYTTEELNSLFCQIQSGDSRKAIETLSDSTIKDICDSYTEIENKIARDYCNKSELFINKYPECYGKKRPTYSPLSSKDKIKILQWIADIAQRRITCKDRIYLKLLDGYHLSKMRKFLINALPNKKLRHKLRVKFR